MDNGCWGCWILQYLETFIIPNWQQSDSFLLHFPSHLLFSRNNRWYWMFCLWSLPTSPRLRSEEEQSWNTSPCAEMSVFLVVLSISSMSVNLFTWAATLWLQLLLFLSSLIVNWTDLGFIGLTRNVLVHKVSLAFSLFYNKKKKDGLMRIILCSRPMFSPKTFSSTHP